MRSKVFYAKSNNCSSTMDIEVNAYLKDLNIEVFEYRHGQGPEWNMARIRECDYLIILPEDTDEQSVTLGKGLYNMVKTFQDYPNTLVITESESNSYKTSVKVIPVHKGHDLTDSIEITNSNNWTYYAELYLQDGYEPIELSEIILQEEKETVMRETTGGVFWKDCVDEYGRFLGDRDMRTDRDISSIREAERREIMMRQREKERRMSSIGRYEPDEEEIRMPSKPAAAAPKASVKESSSNVEGNFMLLLG